MAFSLTTVLPIGADMPKADVKMKDVSGKEVSIKDAVKTNGVLVMFSCNTCPYVIKNEERTIAIGEFAQKMNVGVILLNSNEAQRTSDDSFEEMKKYAAEKKYNWSYVMDQNNEVADAFGANRTPECFLFDKNLKLVYHGAIDDNPSDETKVTRHHLREAINELAGGKEITVKESRSVGCSIKRKS
jgi:peroxiredoxin